MGKRRAVDDDEEGSGTPMSTSKRARSENNSDYEDGPRAKQSRKSRAAEEAEDAENDEDSEDEDDSEAKDKIIKAFTEKRKQTGGVAEHGIIERIELTQFMCHKYLEFDFGPQVNFIIGHNGSGKSAVLSGITVALGGKANSTGRGSGLKSFIREGQGAAEVTIYLKNKGSEAYKHDEYGDSIVITRRFTKDGASSWKVKGKSGQVVSTKKDEIAAISDHMAIQVDNPLNVLTQDLARQFLSASTGADKYKFFLKGTQLAQLSEEYEVCLENINTTAKVLSQKKLALPDLKARFEDAKAKFQEASKALEQKKKVDELKKELAWAHVGTKQKEMEDKHTEVAKAQSKLPKIQEHLDQCNATVNSSTEDVRKFEGELEALEGVDELDEQKAVTKEKLSSTRKKIQQIQADINQVNTSAKQYTAEMANLQMQIDAENKRDETSSRSKREEAQREISEIEQKEQSQKDERSTALARIRELDEKAKSVRAEGEAVEQQINRAKTEYLEVERSLQSLAQAEKDTLAPLGKNMRGVLAAIKKTNWFGDAPLGPYGMYVQLKEPAFGDLLRNRLGSLLSSFAITDARDRKPLLRILQEHGNARPSVTIYEKDMFDYSHGEPPSDVLTVLRALEFSDEYVKRLMINAAQIEQYILADSRRNGEQILRDLRTAGNAWTADGFKVTRYREGGESSSPLWNGTKASLGPYEALWRSTDSAAVKQRNQKRLADLDADIQRLQAEMDQKKTVWEQTRREFDALKRQEDNLNRSLNNLNRTKNDLKQRLQEDVPANIAGLQAAYDDAKTAKENVVAQYQHMIAELENYKQQQRQEDEEMARIKAKYEEHDREREALKDQVLAAVQIRLKAQQELAHWQSTMAKHTAAVNDLKEASEVLEEEFKNWTAKAEQYCARVPNPRDPDTVQRNLSATQTALKQREDKQGQSVEEIAVEVNKTEEEWKTADTDLRQMAALNRNLKISLRRRMKRWHDFRRHIALRCKVIFQHNLSYRGYFGKVMFNHEKGLLDLKVDTNESMQQQQSSSKNGNGVPRKDPKLLSGGEKSFSTICLLLSLWDAIGCPIRCLDEFDVFMDSVNRRISMKMMIETANSSDKRQYILITPQDMTNIDVSTSVRVNRMPDPARGGGSLQAS